MVMMHDAIEIVKCDIAEVQLPQRLLPDFLGYNYAAIDQITIRDYTDSRINADGARMPRRRSPPRLYLDKIRQQWIIRDGASFVALAALSQTVSALKGGSSNTSARSTSRRHPRTL